MISSSKQRLHKNGTQGPPYEVTSSDRFNSRRWATSRRRANKTRRTRLPISSISTREDQMPDNRTFWHARDYSILLDGPRGKNHAYCWLRENDLRIAACKNNVTWALVCNVSCFVSLHISGYRWLVPIHIACYHIFIFFSLRIALFNISISHHHINRKAQCTFPFVKNNY